MSEWHDLYSRVDWAWISKRRNKIILAEIGQDGPGFRSTHELDEDLIDRPQLLSTKVYVTYNIKEHIQGNDFITRYEILDSIVDEHNNLVLIAKSNTYETR